MTREISGARLISIEGMGHELPRGAWPVIVQAMLKHTGSGALAAGECRSIGGWRRDPDTSAYTVPANT
jgi:hypothetical protein